MNAATLPGSSSSALINAFWRAAAYCLLPRVIWLSLMPLLISLGALALLGGLFWADTVGALAQSLGQWGWSRWLLEGLAAWGLPVAPQWAAGALLLLVTVPAVVVACLLLVSWFMTPAVARLVADRRFGGPAPARAAGPLAVLHRTPWWASLAWSIGHSALAGAALVLSLPLWLLPPLGLLLPPLIWGWLTYRIMAFDVLSEHATPQERRALLRTHRLPLLGMGVACGLLSTAPAMLWALSVFAVLLAPLMVALSVWVYTLIFVFASLWFAHFLLPALHAARGAAHGGAGPRGTHAPGWEPLQSADQPATAALLPPTSRPTLPRP